MMIGVATSEMILSIFRPSVPDFSQWKSSVILAVDAPYPHGSVMVFIFIGKNGIEKCYFKGSFMKEVVQDPLSCIWIVDFIVVEAFRSR